MSPAIWPVGACGRFTALMGGHAAEAVGSHYAVYGDKPDICLAETGCQSETRQPPGLFHGTLKASGDEAGTSVHFDAQKEAWRNAGAFQPEADPKLSGD